MLIVMWSLSTGSLLSCLYNLLLKTPIVCDVSVADCVDNMSEFEVDPSETTLLQFKKIDRCLRVLENVSA